ncbi:ATP-dependent helicase [Deinococcus hopiensis]|uniref:DNA 3'-5' helicase n=1 Tax=Deinococcus hopiensis KR-140 TaxID=695939 RepID=A0A1W1UML8_9DEIO|nr:ATP-dependent helicase [Deinococcus hopiensis]SMB81954.1 DNA helicase-2 / ATP-dependent DNA helicase PcrA [Deinococcus hopiensis KR-140]
MQPTAEQRQIIEHTVGHALVFAVAGSGKTTTMVERILNLVRHQQVRPRRILACTFSREAARTIEQRLARHPETTGVKVATLHALAYTILQEAKQLGLTRIQRGEDGFARKLFQEARQQLISEDVNDKSAFYNIKYDDFQTYMSVQKGHLRLPYVPGDLPTWAQQLIGLPDRGIELYADLYARHDALRREADCMDFDDSIVEAWLLMARFPVLSDAMKGRWDFVHVDEFQDVNLAQSEMLHLLASSCTSYMAIGDDDQTVYQWRGADPRFILDFATRYQAQTFTLSTNFRCPMGVIALADQVIQHNTVRAPKRLRASRGDNGVHLHGHGPGQAAHVAIQVIQEGRSPSDIVILVRTYAQTGEIEQVFLEREVPYLMVGAVPFYQRQEVSVLLAYLRLALADLDVQRDVPLTAKQRVELLKDWQIVANAPNRFLRTQTVHDLGRELWHNGKTLALALEELAPGLRGNGREVLKLSEALAILTDDLGLAQGKETLLQFADTIGYTEHLIKTAPTREFGEERSGSVRALAEMAQERSLGELVTFITHLRTQGRHVERLADAEDDGVERVTIMTAFRAKGLEWPVVIVPDCKAGLYRIRESADQAAAEEERRVFYVALTRPKQELHLVVDGHEPTPFLTVVKHEALVHGHTRLVQLMARDPVHWSARDTLEASELLRTYGHEQYVQLWLDGGYRGKLLRRIDALRAALVGQPQPYHGQAETVEALSLEPYRQHGDLKLTSGDDFDAFQDLEVLVRELHQRYAPPAVNSSGQTAGRSTGTALRPTDTRVGMAVKHKRFGEGVVLAMKGSGDRTEVEIRFNNLEATKKMLVAYANLQDAS